MITAAVLVVVVALVYIGYRVVKSGKPLTAGTFVGGTSAFAKLAEADGKIIALKVASAAKKEEALAAHKALDYVHAILG